MSNFFSSMVNQATGGQRSPLSPNVVYVRMTDLGKEKLANCDAVGRKYDVALAIMRNQPCNKEEVANSLGLPENKVRYFMEELFRDQWIEVAND